MTMHYSNSEEAYVTNRAAKLARERAAAVAMPDPNVAAPISALSEMPDMNEADRIWKLLCDSAKS